MKAWEPYTDVQLAAGLVLVEGLKKKFPSIASVYQHSEISTGVKGDAGPMTDDIRDKMLTVVSQGTGPLQ